MKTDPTNNSVSPRRRFHRPGERAYTASHHVPVLTGLPAVEVDRFQNPPLRDEQEIPTDTESESLDINVATPPEEPVTPNASDDHPAKTPDHPVKTSDHPAKTPDHTVATSDHPAKTHDHGADRGDTNRNHSEARVRDLMYTVGGTLVAFLLVYVVVSRLNNQPITSATPEPKIAQATASVEPVVIPEATITPLPVSRPDPVLPAAGTVVGTVVPGHNWAETSETQIDQLASKSEPVSDPEIQPICQTEVPLVAEAPGRKPTEASRPAKATLQDRIEPTVATPTPQPVPDVQFPTPSEPVDTTSETLQTNGEPDYPSTGHGPLPRISTTQTSSPLQQPTTNLIAPSTVEVPAVVGIREARLKGSIQPFSMK